MTTNKLLSTPVLFVVYTLFSVSGMVIFKYAAPRLKASLQLGEAYLGPAAIAGIGASMYVVSFLLWLVILSREPLTVVYPIAVGLTMAFSAVMAVVVLREHVSWVMVLGMLMIAGGVTLLAKAT